MSADIFCTPILSVSTVNLGDVVVVRVAGEVDMTSGEPMATALRGELAAQPECLVVDLLGVTFCGSAGLHALMIARQEARTAQVGLRLVATGAAVLRPLEISGLAPLFRIHASVREALDSLTA